MVDLRKFYCIRCCRRFPSWYGVSLVGIGSRKCRKQTEELGKCKAPGGGKSNPKKIP